MLYRPALGQIVTSKRKSKIVTTCCSSLENNSTYWSPRSTVRFCGRGKSASEQIIVRHYSVQCCCSPKRLEVKVLIRKIRFLSIKSNLLFHVIIFGYATFIAEIILGYLCHFPIICLKFRPVKSLSSRRKV